MMSRCITGTAGTTTMTILKSSRCTAFQSTLLSCGIPTSKKSKSRSSKMHLYNRALICLMDKNSVLARMQVQDSQVMFRQCSHQPWTHLFLSQMPYHLCNSRKIKTHRNRLAKTNVPRKISALQSRADLSSPSRKSKRSPLTWLRSANATTVFNQTLPKRCRRRSRHNGTSSWTIKPTHGRGPKPNQDAKRNQKEALSCLGCALAMTASFKPRRTSWCDLNWPRCKQAKQSSR